MMKNNKKMMVSDTFCWLAIVKFLVRCSLIAFDRGVDNLRRDPSTSTSGKKGSFP